VTSLGPGRTRPAASPPSTPTSLFLLALPRSFSSKTYSVACGALGLEEPGWTTAGEILNRDRLSPGRAQALRAVEKFTSPGDDPDAAAALEGFLGENTSPRGFAYKDVTQPLFLSSWSGLARFRVLRIHRELHDVAFFMLKRGWYYPYVALHPRLPSSMTATYYLLRVLRFLDPLADRLTLPTAGAARLEELAVRGIVLAYRALEDLEVETVEYEDLIRDEEPLRGALQRLYPAIEVPPLRYIDERFQQRREAVLRARETRRYGEVRELVGRVQADLESTG